MKDKRIDLVAFINSSNTVEWPYGNVYAIGKDGEQLHATIDAIVKQSVAEWVLFWDFSLGSPDEELIKELAAKNVDVFHAGLMLGTRGLPDALSYMHPTWMYNIDGSKDVTHTNFRMNFSAAMVRLNVFRTLGNIDTAYSSWDMLGVAYGYKVIKQGGIIRYHAGLIQQSFESDPAPLRDEWIFARTFFPKKWQWWMLLNKPGLLKNIRERIATGNVQYKELKPALHYSEKTDAPVTYATVSVLAPTLDRYPYLEEELRELNEQTILPHEVLVTDQTDKEHRQDIKFSKYKNLTVKYFPQDDKGQCLAWNKLIQEATGEYVFFFGDDAYDIKPGLIEKMLQTMQRFDADMVASNVRERGIVYGKDNPYYFLSDSFPITLIKKSVVEAAGGMDMFFNRNVKADHDLAMRCHLNGALMVFDSSALIGHHRAPSGGLRTHNARVVTNFMTKNTVRNILNPSASEIFIYKQYYTDAQLRSHVRIKYMNQVIINGNILKKVLRLFYLLYKIPSMRRGYKANLKTAEDELIKRGLLRQE